MARFRSLATVVVLLISLLTVSDVSGKGGGGKRGGGGGHHSAPHRAAPKVHQSHHSGPKPNRVARKPAPQHAGHPANKQAHHPAKPKGPAKVSKPESKHKEPEKKEPGKKDPAKKTPPKKEPGKKDPGKKEPGKSTNPSGKPKTPAKRPDAKGKEVAKKSDDKHRLRDMHFVGRRHAAVHHFAHFDHHHHWFSFDRHWWWNFVDYPNSFDNGLSLPGDYCIDGDPNSWVNYEAMVPPADVQAQPAPVIQQDQGLPISRTGGVLAERLDGMDVDSHWLTGQDVSWKTGNAVDDNAGPASNGCQFVAAVCSRLKVAMSDPVPESFFPASQYDWLVNEGTGQGWVALGGDVEAQLVANQGWVVVAAWKSPSSGGDRTTDGQMAIVHPSSKPAEAVNDRGPQITLAGVHNQNDVALKDSFPQAAWDQVIYLACRPRW